MSILEHLRDFLSYLEKLEAKLLTWGYVDGAFTEAEVYEHAEDWVQQLELDIDPRMLADELYTQKLIMEISPDKWRTRMAETVRLMARLRQWRHFHNGRWQLAPTLVSDFRFSVRPRRYPERNVTREQLLDNVKENLNKIELEALEVMTDRGDEFRLSAFQNNAACQLFADTHSERSRGMIVSAGTGTGKTLAFYLPAFTKVAAKVMLDEANQVQAIALYPRNELLKDQFMDAYREARKFDKWLSEQGRRCIRIGAIFGATPRNEHEVNKKWKKLGSDYICPYMPCPTCGETLVWLNRDLQVGTHKLTCSKSTCRTIVKDIVLTREQALVTQPDFLFTTTEMLNRYMSHVKFGPLVGLFTDVSPKWVLLDEAHTYTGTHGAQVALLLRRWQRAIGKPLHFTGLSATLEDAVSFFSQLTGLKPKEIEGIQADQLGPQETRGHEYQLVLRGDPGSGTSTLSTTIQTMMLMRRMLETNRPVTAFYGKKVFVFADDLDVTNRMYHNVLDAEGRWASGREKQHLPLASLRASASSEPNLPIRLREGQAWTFAESIGHDLQRKLNVGRTSSQDIGVSREAEIVVATASLEVGYNDKLVGAVIQHKAPLDMAAFLQRKGRAGRDPNMRPWMITVLSDYGRDRLTYQSYDMLFEPILHKKELPIKNRYVLRMQAVFSMLDWLTIEFRTINKQRVSIWDACSRPSSEGFSHVRLQLLDIVHRVLTEEQLRRRLETHLQYALNIEREEVLSIVWEPPRSLMMSVLPTLMRRLENNFKQLNGEDEYNANTPLTEFVPHTLFSDLTLPEVEITAPGRFQKDNEDPEVQLMPIVQAMNSFAPGRVTRRFGVEREDESHWVKPMTLTFTPGIEMLDIHEFCLEYAEMGEVPLLENGQVIHIPLLRPWHFDTKLIDKEISPTSNGYLNWQTYIRSTTVDLESGFALDIPDDSRWSHLLSGITAFTHQNQEPVSVYRFASDSEHTLKFTNGKDPFEKRVRYTREGQRVALGFQLEVDGLCFRYRLPTSIMNKDDSNQLKLRSYRVAYFVHLVKTDTTLRKHANVFELDRIAECYLSSLVATSFMHHCDLMEARRLIMAHPLRVIMNRVLSVVFHMNAVEIETEEEVEDGDNHQYLHTRLLELSGEEEVATTLHALAQTLWSEPDKGWTDWAIKRWKMTLGAALLQACKELTGTFQNDDLIVDIEFGPNDCGDMEPLIWITETTGGGSGIIEEVVRRYHEDPRRFYRLVENVLGPSDQELIHTELSRAIELTLTNPNVAQAFLDLREAADFRSAQEALPRLQAELRRYGTLVTRTVLNSLLNRVLKPGSSRATDQLLHDILLVWQEQEQRLGIELDCRTIAYVLSVDNDYSAQIQSALSHIDTFATEQSSFRYQILYGLLWPRGNTVRSQAIASYSPFASGTPIDREILRDTLPGEDVLVLGSSPNLNEEIQQALARTGTVHIMAPVEEVHKLRRLFMDLASHPIDIGFLHMYPRVESVRRESDQYVATLVIREAFL